jgi:hypothetical protein
MRLLNVDSFDFQNFNESPTSPPPPYAIASHRWIAGTEVFLQEFVRRKGRRLFENLYNARYRRSLGWRKIRGFIAFMKVDLPSIKWLWIDTCCINQDSSQEVSTAIRSMFRWYARAEVCLAYLDDVPAVDNLTAFDKSVWFQRGWTLQELLAPTTVVFLTHDWRIIGHKGRSGYGRSGVSMRTGPSLGSRISAITQITENVLQDYDAAENVAVDEKLSWIQNRKTMLDEDKWYCMLGILGALDMEIQYGAGGADTYRRLQRNLAQQGRWPRQASRSSTTTNALSATRTSNGSAEGDEVDDEFQRVIYAEPMQDINSEGITRAINEFLGLLTTGHPIPSQENRRIQNIRAQNTILQNSRAILHNVNHRADGINTPIPDSVAVDTEVILQEVYNCVRAMLMSHQSTDQCDENDSLNNDLNTGDTRLKESNDLPGTRVEDEEAIEGLADEIPQSDILNHVNIHDLRRQDALDDLNFHLHSLETFWDDAIITKRANEMRQMIRMLELHPDADLDRTWRIIEVATRNICSSLPPTYSLFHGGLNKAKADLEQSKRIRPKFFGLYLEYREPYPNLYSLDETHYQEKPVTLIFLSINHKECRQTIKAWLQTEDFGDDAKDLGSSFVISNIIVVDKLRKAICGTKVTIKVISDEKDIKRLTTSCDGREAFWILCFKTSEKHAFRNSCDQVSFCI